MNAIQGGEISVGQVHVDEPGPGDETRHIAAITPRDTHDRQLRHPRPRIMATAMSAATVMDVVLARSASPSIAPISTQFQMESACGDQSR